MFNLRRLFRLPRRERTRTWPVREARVSRGSMGGYVYPIDPMRLERFLFAGADSADFVYPQPTLVLEEAREEDGDGNGNSGCADDEVTVDFGIQMPLEGEAVVLAACPGADDPLVADQALMRLLLGARSGYPVVISAGQIAYRSG